MKYKFTILLCCLFLNYSFANSNARPIPGDINNDGIINVLDIVLSINFILSIDNPSNEEMTAADLNEDGILNVLDIVLLVNMILGTI